MTEYSKKYLFIYLRTGGGHLAPARAIANYIKEKLPNNADPILIDGFAETNSFARLIIEDGYRYLQSKAKWFYEFLYATHKLKTVSNISAFLVSLNMKKYLKEIIIKEKPVKIVLFHFFLIKPVYNILKEMDLKIPVVTIVTDPYIAHPLWFLQKDQTFVIFSERLRNSCLTKGIALEKLNLFPFILDEKFTGSIPGNEKNIYKKKHGFKKEKVLLILGGGDGIPKGQKILKKILHDNNNFEIAIVCGKNKKLFKQAKKLQDHFGSEILKVFSFVDFIYELLAAADVVITKCGASTFMEILMMKKVPVVNSYIWEQEKGNVDFIVSNGLGVYEKRVSKLPKIINTLFTNQQTLDKYLQNIQRANLKNGTKEVAEFIVS